MSDEPLIKIDVPPKYGFSFSWVGLKITSSIRFHSYWKDDKFKVHNFALCGFTFDIVRRWR